jgi:LuxR family maltose regulon positive regulatory protein
VRAFLDEGSPMVRLLQKLLASHHAASPAYVRDLLAAFPAAAPDATLSPAPASPTPAQSNPTADASHLLVDPLSPRELEVLRLIASGASNRDVARELVVSLGTVKKHLNNIFAKLGAHSRTQAVARAREADLLPQ